MISRSLRHLLLMIMLKSSLLVRSLTSSTVGTNIHTLETPHGRVALVSASSTLNVDQLYAEEKELTKTMSESTRRTFLLGRTAMHQLLDHPILKHIDGRPLLPEGYRGSISHKGDLGAALLLPLSSWLCGQDVHVGVDLEHGTVVRPERLARRILRPDEMPSLGRCGIPLEEDVLIRFSCKESVYKAVYPFVGRYFGFRDASVSVRGDGTARTTLHLPDPDVSNIQVDCTWQWVLGDTYLVTTACARHAR